MRHVSDKSRILYLLILIVVLICFGVFWLDYLGLLSVGEKIRSFRGEAPAVTEAQGDEPSLLEREAFEKEKQSIEEREENLDKKEAVLNERETDLKAREDQLEEKLRGLEMEKKKFEDSKTEYAGYERNVKVLAEKIAAMPPEESVKIMVNWEEPLIIDVLRQMDADSAAAGTSSMTSYLITLMPKDKASRIMYLMTQI